MIEVVILLVVSACLTANERKRQYWGHVVQSEAQIGGPGHAIALLCANPRGTGIMPARAPRSQLLNSHRLVFMPVVHLGKLQAKSFQEQ